MWKQFFVRRLPLMLLMLASFMLLSSSFALGARRVVKKRISGPSRWYGSADVTYSNWVRSQWEGGGESNTAGIQFGLNLPQSFSAFVRISAMPQPIGLLDIRLGLSKGWTLGDALRPSLSSSFSVPTSEYSRSIHQLTQASLAATLQYDRGASTVSLTAFGTRAFYSSPPEAVYESGLFLRNGNGNGNGPKIKKDHPRAGTPLASDLTDEVIEINYEEGSYLTRFDRLAGGALDLSYRFMDEWTFNTGGSLTRSTFSSQESIWTSEVTLIQATFTRKFVSVYASAGLLDSTPEPLWPKYKTYNVGLSYFFPN